MLDRDPVSLFREAGRDARDKLGSPEGGGEGSVR